MAVGGSELALGSWAAVEIRGTIHTELPSLWSLFPAFSLGQKMFANNKLVSVHTQGLRSAPQGPGAGWAQHRQSLHLASSVQVASCGLPKTCSDAKTEGFGVFRSLDSLISLFFHLLAVTSACQYLRRSVLCFSSLFPLCLLHGSSFSSHGVGAL